MPSSVELRAAMYVVFEDETLGVVWKPQGMKTTMEHANQKPSAQDESANLLSRSSHQDALAVPLACYTLDAGVEGLLVMAKTAAAKSRCESGHVSLRFQALVSGRVQLPVTELSSEKEWRPRDFPNNDTLSRRQYRAKGLCVMYNRKGLCSDGDIEQRAKGLCADQLICKFKRRHACAGCSGPHAFLDCPENADIEVQAKAEAALAQALQVDPPDLQPRGDAVRPQTPMRLCSTTRCMGGDTYISAVELEPGHGFHCISMLSEQLKFAGHPVHPQCKQLKGNYRGVFLACTGVTVPPVADCVGPPLVLNVAAPIRFERLLKKEDGFFAANRHLAETEYEACGYPAPIWGDSDETVPVQYQTGVALFYGRRFLVTPDVLIPRPCYETLITPLLHHLRLSDINPDGEKRAAGILDLGCGSGCLLLTCLVEIPHLFGVGFDICPKALKVAKSNAERFDVAERCGWMQNDFNCLSEAFECVASEFDAIVFNPPYLERSAWLSASCAAEPGVALFVDSKYDAYQAAEVGLRTCRSKGRPLLSKGGLLVIGLGSGHLATVREIYEAHGEFRCEDVIKDSAGIERCIVLQTL